MPSKTSNKKKCLSLRIGIHRASPLWASSSENDCAMDRYIYMTLQDEMINCTHVHTEATLRCTRSLFLVNQGLCPHMDTAFCVAQPCTPFLQSGGSRELVLQEIFKADQGQVDHSYSQTHNPKFTSIYNLASIIDISSSEVFNAKTNYLCHEMVQHIYLQNRRQMSYLMKIRHYPVNLQKIKTLCLINHLPSRLN